MKNIWMYSTFALAICLVLSFFLNFPKAGFLILSKEQAAERAINYINENLVEPGTFANLIEVREVSGVYEVLTSYRGREILVYVTKDGRFLFVSYFDLTKKPETEIKTKTCEDLKKADKPILETFIVSYCPYGLQMVRVLNNIIENIPELEAYIKIRYLGQVIDNEIRAMHGEKEAKENLRQICIREEQAEKFWEYLACFIEEGEVRDCLKKAKVDEDKLNKCMEGEGINYAKEDFSLQDKYGVTGSPTLILNGEQVSEFDFGGRNAEAVKTIICCGFEEEPSYCEKELTTQTAAIGFSKEYSSSSSSPPGRC